jgi:hypothetical protein
MNLIKKMKLRGEKDVKIKRHDVYIHMMENKEMFRRVFGEKEPWESVVYDYMEELTKEGYFKVVNKIKTKGKAEIKELTSTQDAERLREQLWIAVNLKTKEDIGNIVRDALKGLVELNSNEREKIVKSVMHEIARQSEIKGLPFASLQSLSSKEILNIFNGSRESKE